METDSASVTLASDDQPAKSVAPDVTGDRASEGRMSLAVKGVLPLLLLAALLAVFAQVGPIGVFRAAFPPIEELTFERIAFPQAGLIRVYLVNGGRMLTYDRCCEKTIRRLRLQLNYLNLITALVRIIARIHFRR